MTVLKFPIRLCIASVLVCIVGLSAVCAYAQVAGETDIYLVDVIKARTKSARAKSTKKRSQPAALPEPAVGGMSAKRLAFSLPVKVTYHAGYDNQPSFTPDNRALLFVSVREGTQSDIYRFSLKDSTTTRLTNTPDESEYSPSVMPSDGRSIAVVRVEKDSTQRLWRFSESGTAIAPILKNVKPVGYYGWIGASNLVMFILGTGAKANKPETFTLQTAAISESASAGGIEVRTDTAATNIGRCLRRIPVSIAGGQLAASFVQKAGKDSAWSMKRVNIKNRIVSFICPTVPGSEDYVWMQNGTLLMADGTKLFVRQPRKDNEWHVVADFAQVIPKGAIKRLALSQDEKRLAFVVQE
jgi:WD40-like Beta Propeller Repeat